MRVCFYGQLSVRTNVLIAFRQLVRMGKCSIVRGIAVITDTAIPSRCEVTVHLCAGDCLARVCVSEVLRSIDYYRDYQ